jgi:hypothetical protein
MRIERYCPKCKAETEHDHEEDIDDEEWLKTTIDVCRVCGNADVDVDPIDLFDFDIEP